MDPRQKSGSEYVDITEMYDMQNQNQNSILVKRQNDNITPGGGGGGV